MLNPYKLLKIRYSIDNLKNHMINYSVLREKNTAQFNKSLESKSDKNVFINV